MAGEEQVEGPMGRLGHDMGPEPDYGLDGLDIKDVKKMGHSEALRRKLGMDEETFEHYVGESLARLDLD